MEINKIYQGDSLEVLKTFPDESINMCMTSPPYWGLRDYGVEGQLGLEPTFNDYINKLCSIFDEVKRVLKDDGTCWVNLGDTYVGGCGGPDSFERNNRNIEWKDKSLRNPHRKDNIDIPNKCLCMIPFRFALEMVNRGWILRNTIIWHKPNCMPASVEDRFTVDFEYLFFFAKSKKYYFEQQFQPYVRLWAENNGGNLSSGTHKKEGKMVEQNRTIPLPNENGANKRCVWKITTQPYSEAHFATYPEELCITPIKAGCPEFVCKKCGKARERISEHDGYEATGHGDNASPKTIKLGEMVGMSKKSALLTRQYKKYKDLGYSDCGCNEGFEGGIVLDPFAGAGTTLMTAKKLNRQFVGIELNESYIKMAEKRIEVEVGLLF